MPLVQSGNTRRATADDMAPTCALKSSRRGMAKQSLSAKLAAIEASIPSGGGAPFHGWVSGSYVTQALVAGALSTISGASNRLEVMPWQPQRDMTVDQISVYVTATGAADFRLVITAATPTGCPATCCGTQQIPRQAPRVRSRLALRGAPATRLPRAQPIGSAGTETSGAGT